jgi:homoaconitase
MQPRYLGCQLIIARSFARIHETNLKKQGVLPLTFVNEADYDLFTGGATVSSEGLVDLVNGKGNGEITLLVRTKDGQEHRVSTRHTMSRDQLEWFRAGSALNRIAAMGAQ